MLLVKIGVQRLFYDVRKRRSDGCASPRSGRARLLERALHSVGDHLYHGLVSSSWVEVALAVSCQNIESYGSVSCQNMESVTKSTPRYSIVVVCMLDMRCVGGLRL